MSRIKLALELVEDLKRLTESVENLIEAMKANNLSGEDSSEFTDIREGTGDITMEQLREVMRAKSKAGKMEEVKALVKRYGGEKLTDIEPRYYAEVLKEAEGL